MSTNRRQTNGRLDHTSNAADSSSDAASASRRTAIGLRLRAAREMAGLSQGQVARLLHLHRPTVTEVEAGRRRLPAEELADFARIYGVTTTWLTSAQAEDQDPLDARLELAARELQKLKPQDLERVLRLLSALRPGREDTP
jgi:transcriptional regulator with XRE-family HTH domain